MAFVRLYSTLPGQVYKGLEKKEGYAGSSAYCKKKIKTASPACMNRCPPRAWKKETTLNICYAEYTTTRPAMRRRRRQRTIQHAENNNVRPETR